MRPDTEVPLYAVILLAAAVTLLVGGVLALDPSLAPGEFLRIANTGVGGSWVLVAAVLFPVVMLFALLGLRQAV